MQAVSEDTIIALATPSGRSGVAVVRLSGPGVDAALGTLGVAPLPAPRQASLRRLRHPVSGEVIDQGLVLRFKAPHSFTGEDVAELQVHGSRAVLAELLEALTALPGLRLAEPGEFARRAFYHQRLDLAEVEGLADLIEAETAAQKRQALRQMEGGLSERCHALRESLLRTLAYAEAFLDFPDEDLPPEALREMHGELAQVAGEVAMLLSGARTAETIRDGFHVALLGVPNAGKSSLLNALLKREAAIVTDIPGTTRDVLEARLNLQGYLVILSDTAGLRDSDDLVEKEGIRRAHQAAERADLRVWLIDPSQEPEAQQRLLESAGAGDLIVISKADLASAHPAPPLPDSLQRVLVSSHSGQGIDALLEVLISRMVSGFSQEEALLTRQRHLTAFSAASDHLEAARRQEDLVLKAEEMRLAIRALASVIGIVDVDNILDVVFGAFCLGK